MRRSAAPSQQGLAPKRPRFNPPFRSSNPVPLSTPRPLPSQQVTTSGAQGLPRTPQPASRGNDECLATTKEIKETSNDRELVQGAVSSIQPGDDGEKNDHQASRNHGENIPGRTSIKLKSENVSSKTSVIILESDANDTGESQPQGQTESQQLAGGDVRHTTQYVHGSTHVDGEGAAGTRPQHLQLKKSGVQRKPFMVKQLTPTVKPPTGEAEEDGPKRHYYSVMW